MELYYTYLSDGTKIEVCGYDDYESTRYVGSLVYEYESELSVAFGGGRIVGTDIRIPMKSKMKTRLLMPLLMVTISIIILHACVRTLKHQSLLKEKKIDSVAIAYGRNRYLSFADVTAAEFAKLKHDSLFYIYNRDTIEILSDRISRLSSAKDSLSPDVDARVMLILYRKCGKNDSLFISALPNHPMQLNQITKLQDSIIWVQIRDIICMRDLIFNQRFKNSSGYY